MAEYLKLRKVHPWGAEAFNQISVNISKDECNLKLDAGEICMSALLCCLVFVVLNVHADENYLDPIVFSNEQKTFLPGVQDIHYNECLLLEQLEVCADTLEKAERFELLGHLYRLIVPMYEAKRNYEALGNCYSHLAQACNKIVEVTRSGKRLLGRFYRIAFFGTVRYIIDEVYIFIIFKSLVYTEKFIIQKC